MISLGVDYATLVNAFAAVVLVGATIALVCFTRALATATQNLVTTTADLVAESAETRRLSVMPALFIDLGYFGQHAFVDLYSVGPGAAVDVDVILEWRESVKDEGTIGDDTFRMWRTNVLPSGARHRFNPPTNKTTGQPMIVDELAAFVDKITLTGTVKDVLDNVYRVSSEIPAFAQVVAGEKISQRQLAPAAPDERIGYELHLIRELLERRERG